METEIIDGVLSGSAFAAAIGFLIQTYQLYRAKKVARTEVLLKLHDEFAAESAQAKLFEKLIKQSGFGVQVRRRKRLTEAECLALFEMLWFFEKVAYLYESRTIGKRELRLFYADYMVLETSDTVNQVLDDSPRGYFEGFLKLGATFKKFNHPGNPSNGSEAPTR